MQFQSIYNYIITFNEKIFQDLLKNHFMYIQKK